jgi:hypothetical protein
MYRFQASFTVPTPDVYKKWNVIYKNLKKAGCAPWRAKPRFDNHYQMWFETERESDLEKICELIPYEPKIYRIVDGIARKVEYEAV